jgi:hypothetical protein
VPEEPCAATASQRARSAGVLPLERLMSPHSTRFSGNALNF